jgi:DNA replication protein DnaC
LNRDKCTSQEAEDLRDIIKQRSYGKSTVFTTQLPIDHWGEVIGDAIILDALIDRLEPPGIVIKMTGESYRKTMKKNKNVETSN